MSEENKNEFINLTYHYEQKKGKLKALEETTPPFQK